MAKKKRTMYYLAVSADCKETIVTTDKDKAGSLGPQSSELQVSQGESDDQDAPGEHEEGPAREDRQRDEAFQDKTAEGIHEDSAHAE